MANTEKTTGKAPTKAQIEGELRKTKTTLEETQKALQESMDLIFPLVKKYGGVVVGLTLDENGIPSDAEGRAALAEKIIEEAKKYGIDKKDIVIDVLAMTISSEPQ